MAGITHGSGAARCRRIAPFARWRPDTPAAIAFAASTDKAFTRIAALERLASVSLGGGGTASVPGPRRRPGRSTRVGRLKTAVRQAVGAR